MTLAWRDWKTAGTGASSSICKGLKHKYGLSWVGLAAFRAPNGTDRKIRIGARGNGDKPFTTAFPAVNNTFSCYPIARGLTFGDRVLRAGPGPDLTRCRGRPAGQHHADSLDQVRPASGR